MKKHNLHDLKYNIADYISPRLKEFRDLIDQKKILSVPEFLDSNIDAENLTFEDKEKIWSQIIEKMIFPFDYYSNSDKYEHLNSDEINLKFKEGMDLFAKHFINLWI
jgi:hypothetical protein